MNNGVITFTFTEFWRTYLRGGIEYRAEAKEAVKIESDANNDRVCELKVLYSSPSLLLFFLFLLFLFF